MGTLRLISLWRRLRVGCCICLLPSGTLLFPLSCGFRPASEPVALPCHLVLKTHFCLPCLLRRSSSCTCCQAGCMPFTERPGGAAVFSTCACCCGVCCSLAKLLGPHTPACCPCRGAPQPAPAALQGACLSRRSREVRRG